MIQCESCVQINWQKSPFRMHTHMQTHTHTLMHTHTHTCPHTHTHIFSSCTISCMHESVWAEINVTNFFGFSGTFQLWKVLKVNHFRRPFQIKWEIFDYTLTTHSHTHAHIRTYIYVCTQIHTVCISLTLTFTALLFQITFCFFPCLFRSPKKLQNFMSRGYRNIAFKSASKANEVPAVLFSKLIFVEQ